MPQKNECSNIKNLKGFLLFILLSLSTFFIANDIYAADDFKSIMQLIEKGEKEKAAQQLEALGFYGKVQAKKIKSVIAETLELNHNYAHTST